MSRETLLMTLQGDEAEPVVVETEQDTVTLTLEDGREITFDRTELHSATAPLVAGRLEQVA